MGHPVRHLFHSENHMRIPNLLNNKLFRAFITINSK